MAKKKTADDCFFYDAGPGAPDLRVVVARVMIVITTTRGIDKNQMRQNKDRKSGYRYDKTETLLMRRKKAKASRTLALLARPQDSRKLLSRALYGDL